MNPLWPGHPYPLGATFDGSGVNFALFSEVADAVEVCLIADDGTETRVGLTEVDGHVWHGYLTGIEPGQRYGFRVHGPYDPANGHRCNPAKLLLDPYAKAFDGQIDGDGSLYSYDLNSPAKFNDADSLGHTMLSVVVNPFFDWGHETPPPSSMTRTRWVTRCCPWSSTRSLTGATTGRHGTSTTTPSSTRPTSGA